MSLAYQRYLRMSARASLLAQYVPRRSWKSEIIRDPSSENDVVIGGHSSRRPGSLYVELCLFDEAEFLPQTNRKPSAKKNRTWRLL